MRYSILVLAALAAFALSGCDRPTTVVTPPAPVLVPVPGPAGPQGSQGVPGAPAEKGATGETGAPGMTGADGVKGEKGKTGGDTIVVVPATQR
ncbi:MAG: hypothetical protein CVU66_00080 [Deltaproteobacteria bacterium HGW-Deltaproteobacteria-23]|jgi:hypothetical protein|nr:MAG: hypothetical protein CVU66_00080 [Deltaproteobacteria bacterium HGW-Deltaproteobacteria-23]